VSTLSTALQAAIKAAAERAESKQALQQARAANLHPQRPAEAELARLDASVKKNGALARKLRTLTEPALDGVLQDVRSINQSKFLSEAVSALVDAARKPSRVPCILKVCAGIA
jgi:regulator of nonsense transcripts 2